LADFLTALAGFTLADFFITMAFFFAGVALAGLAFAVTLADFASFTAACAAANRAIGTRYGEHDT